MKNATTWRASTETAVRAIDACGRILASAAAPRGRVQRVNVEVATRHASRVAAQADAPTMNCLHLRIFGVVKPTPLPPWHQMATISTGRAPAPAVTRWPTAAAPQATHSRDPPGARGCSPLAPGRDAPDHSGRQVDPSLGSVGSPGGQTKRNLARPFFRSSLRPMGERSVKISLARHPQAPRRRSARDRGHGARGRRALGLRRRADNARKLADRLEDMAVRGLLEG